MKILYNSFLCLLFISDFSFAQQASDYYPSQTGFTWEYLVTPLDSSNNGIDPLAFYQADSFANVADYNGMLADIVLSKSGLLNTLPVQPYTDSSFCHFEGQNAFVYSQVGEQEFLLRTMDSLEIDPDFSFLDFFTSLQGWYSMYRFDQPVHEEYSILSIDTTLHNGVMTIPLRFEYIGERYEDETIETQIGSFNCKKFVVKTGVSLIISPTYLIPIVMVAETLWVAPGNWIVKSFTPSTNVDLSLFGVDPLFIPGVKKDIIQSVTDVEDINGQPLNFLLSQNYPNPFNPSTKIKYHVSDLSYVTLKVYDVLGNEVATLVDGEKTAGVYEVNFNAGNLSSGVYIYRLNANNYVETKNMVLMK